MSWREMSERLGRLRRERHQLESSIPIDPENSLLASMTEVIRDRELAQVRQTVRHNMESIDREIKDTIGRLGAALTTASSSKMESRFRIEGSSNSFPDVVPVPTSSRGTKLGSGTKRDKLLECVRQRLIERRQLMAQGSNLVDPDPPGSRVALYTICHQPTAPHQDRFDRFNIQMLPSVTIATEVNSVAEDRITFTRETAVQTANLTSDSADLEKRHLAHLSDTFDAAREARKDQLSPSVVNVTADDVAQTVVQILQDQLADAFDALQIPNRLESDHIGLRIDNGTQTEEQRRERPKNLKDSSTVTEDQPEAKIPRNDAQTQWTDPGQDRSPSPFEFDSVSDQTILPIASFEDPDKEDEFGDPVALTPPRDPILPRPPSLPDFSDWPEEIQSEVDPEQPPILTSSSSGTDETTISSSGPSGRSLSLSATFSSTSTFPSQEVISSLSEGEVVLFRVRSPGQILVPVPSSDPEQQSSVDRWQMPTDSSENSRSLSRGEVILGQHFIPCLQSSMATDGENVSLSQGELREPNAAHSTALAGSSPDSTQMSFHTIGDTSASSAGQIKSAGISGEQVDVADDDDTAVDGESTS